MVAYIEEYFKALLITDFLFPQIETESGRKIVGTAGGTLSTAGGLPPKLISLMKSKKNLCLYFHRTQPQVDIT